MKLTRMNIDGAKIDDTYLKVIMASLKLELTRLGFITDLEKLNSQSIKIGLRGRSFKVDVSKLGYNAQHNPHMKYKLGYKRTCTPTWNQRVEFNNTVNKVLDHFNVSCKIVSGHFFSPDTMRFFASRLIQDVFPTNKKSVYFVTSEKACFNDPTRVFNVRRYDIEKDSFETIDSLSSRTLALTQALNYSYFESVSEEVTHD